tara:strand:+ start:505 stop:858 length:354 start_codon:yes stop_codon:yes gene_type:complete
MSTLPGEELYRDAIEITTHAQGFSNKEVWGSDVPDEVKSILFIGQNSSKSGVRKVRHFVGTSAPTLSAGSGAGGPSGRTPAETKFDDPGQNGILVLPRPERDAMYRCQNSIQIFGLL